MLSSDLSFQLLVFFFAVFYVVLRLHQRATEDRIAPHGLPWVGLRYEPFAWIKAHLRDRTESKRNLEEGYRKYNKHGLPFVTPNISFRPEVVLPPAYLRWLIDQPDSVLSIYEVLKDDVAFDYTSPASWTFARPFHVEALNKLNLDTLTAGIVDEIRRAFDALLSNVAPGANESSPNPKNWRAIPLGDAMEEVLARIANRVFVGEPLCRDLAYVSHARAFVNALLSQSIAIRVYVPAMLLPVLGPLLALPCRWHDARCAARLVPAIRERLDTAAREQSANVESGKSGAETAAAPTDLLQAMARFAVRSPDPKRDMDPRALCSRLLALNFVGIHTSAVTIQNFWLDVLGRPGKEELLTALRKEAEEVQAKCGGAWNKANVARLALLDSTLRESLRVSAFKGRGVERQVVAEKGTTLPDGTVLPKGTRLGVATTEVHADCELHGNDANVFRPDRFVGKGGTGGVIVTGESFLAFGLGRHACPGRFLAAHELKLLIAYMLLNYDIAPLRCRPENSSFSDFSAPLNVLLRIRPRRDARLE